MSRRVALATLVLALVCASGSGQPVVQTLRYELGIQQRLMTQQLEAMQEQLSELDQACSRTQRLALDLARGALDNESLEDLRLRDEDLGLAESELTTQLRDNHRLRSSLLATKAMVKELSEEIARLEQELGSVNDPLSGVWKVFIEPDGQDGTMLLRLEGTLVQGTYQLDGGWTGSLRGTLVANKVRMERVDSKLGFSAIYYGLLKARDDPPRIEGRWEATQLATGMPSSGIWVAEKVQENEEEY